jgi:hypothetical protein
LVPTYANSIADYKTRLEAEGFLVIPKDRVMKLQQNYMVPGATRASVPWDDYKPSLLRNMGTAMVRRLVEDGAFVSEERKSEYCGEVCTVVTLEGRVILPKASVVQQR